MLYTKRYVNIVSLIITIIIFIATNQMKTFKINTIPISNLFKRNSVLVELSSININQKTKEDTPLIENKNQENNETKEISVTLSKSTKGFFGSIVGKEIYNEKSSLKGYIKDDKKIIEKKVS